MGKQAPTVEWQIAESEADWARLPVPPLLEGMSDANPCRRLHCFLWRTAALLPLISTGGAWGRARVRHTWPASGVSTGKVQAEQAGTPHDHRRKPLVYCIDLLTVWRAEARVLGNETGSRYGFTAAEALSSIIQQAIDEEPAAREGS